MNRPQASNNLISFPSLVPEVTNLGFNFTASQASVRGNLESREATRLLSLVSLHLRSSFSLVYDHGCATLAFVNNIFHDQNICATSCKSFRERNANFQYSLYLLRRILDQNNRKFGQYGLCFRPKQSYLFKTINSIFNKVFCGVSSKQR